MAVADAPAGDPVREERPAAGEVRQRVVLDLVEHARRRSRSPRNGASRRGWIARGAPAPPATRRRRSRRRSRAPAWKRTRASAIRSTHARPAAGSRRDHRRQPAVVGQPAHLDHVVDDRAVASSSGTTPRYTSGARRRFSATSRSQFARRRSTVERSTNGKRTAFLHFHTRSPANATNDTCVSLHGRRRAVAACASTHETKRRRCSSTVTSGIARSDVAHATQVERRRHAARTAHRMRASTTTTPCSRTITGLRSISATSGTSSARRATRRMRSSSAATSSGGEPR